MTPIPVILQSPVLTSRTTRFKIWKLYVLFIQCFCFTWFSDQPIVISLYGFEVCRPRCVFKLYGEVNSVKNAAS